jgi:chromosome segregation ATPase
MFDVTKSKLYAQVMTACASFFGLGADATESEIHEAVEGKSPLAAQLDAARTEAVAAQADQLNTITAQLETMQADISGLRADLEARDQRIADLQVEAQGHVAALETASAAHKKEVATLAGQLSALKAGRATQQDEGGDPHEAAKVGSGAESKVSVIASDSLRALIAKGRPN